MSDDDFNIPPEGISATEESSMPIGQSWQEQDRVLRDLWLQNKTPQEISAILNRSVAAIMTRAARLGLPRRSAPGRKPGSRRISAPTTRTSTTSPRTTTSVRNDDDKSQVSTRICLMCLRAFQSMGKHNRICPSCKGSSEYESAVSLADIHIPV